MQLSATANPETGSWDIAIDGRWLGDGPGEQAITAFAAADPAGLDSARFVVVWLDSGERFTLSALRPRGAKGQDHDAVTVELPESFSEQVFDPRLSTEYGPDGAPRRCGIELWLGEDPEGAQRPLRIGAEATAAPVSHGPVSASPLHAHLNGVPGFALYLLLRR